MSIRQRVRTFISSLRGKKPYPVHENCASCGEMTYLPFSCPYCRKYFCGKHHLPFNHDCANIQEWKDAAPASFRKK